ncbi:unnamed protein product, partial [Angiostrongylus costaricensis]|uniref:Saposin B-type domain-containing protein n=1 Tax=Angiostrongylus costaricensis TaxID=334426 RepID=A0A0R3PBD8_ANGCS
RKSHVADEKKSKKEKKKKKEEVEEVEEEEEEEEEEDDDEKEKRRRRSWHSFQTNSTELDGTPRPCCKWRNYMIFLLFAAFFITINAKSLTVKKSELFGGSDGKSKSNNFTKGFKTVNYEVIPTDYLCDFCNAVIVKLKERQKEEADFEKNMQEECWKYNRTDLDDGNVCELINKVALQRLKNDDAEKICIEEKMCPDIVKELRKKEEKERREKEEVVKRKMEEEGRKINEEIEMIKSEGARLEYEKRREEEARRKTERARISQVQNAYGEDEYVIDEAFTGKVSKKYNFSDAETFAKLHAAGVCDGERTRYCPFQRVTRAPPHHAAPSFPLTLGEFYRSVPSAFTLSAGLI